MTQYLNPVWGCQLFFIGHLTRWRIGERSLVREGIVEIKYPERSCKLSYHGLPTGNQDLGRSGTCRWEAAHAKLTTGGGECNHYSFRSETDRRGWEPSCRLSPWDLEGKEEPPLYDLKAATKVLWWTHPVLHFPETKYFPNRISGWGKCQIESSRK